MTLSEELAAQLVERGPGDGVSLVGPGGLLAELTKQVLEPGLEVEMAEHLGYDEARRRGPQRRQLAQRDPVEDGDHRDRPGRDRGAPGP